MVKLTFVFSTLALALLHSGGFFVNIRNYQCEWGGGGSTSPQLGSGLHVLGEGGEESLVVEGMVRMRPIKILSSLLGRITLVNTNNPYLAGPVPAVAVAVASLTETGRLS